MAPGTRSQAVDKNTLMQLRGSSAKGYAFDRRYDQEAISDNIYDDCISQLVEKVFKVRCIWGLHACKVKRANSSMQSACAAWQSITGSAQS